MCSIKLLCFEVLLAIASLSNNIVCNPVQTNFNNNLRDFSVKEDVNSSDVRTMQSEEPGRYANFAPVRNPIRFKEIPDSALSGSSYSRGLLNHEHSGYGLHEYDENPHYGYGYEYLGDHEHNLDVHHIGYYGGHHGGHHGEHHGGHHHGYGHHHKHYDHALAAKTVLWPIAGIALLGAAAAALVSNPVLLQLGVISGRRKRRDTEEDDQDFHLDSLTKWSFDKSDIDSTQVNLKDSFKEKITKRKVFNRQQKVKKAYPTAQSSIEHVTLDAPEKYNRYSDADRFVPVPIKVKNK